MVFVLSLAAFALAFLVFVEHRPTPLGKPTSKLIDIMTTSASTSVDFIEARLGTPRTVLDCSRAPVQARMMEGMETSENCRYAVFDLQDYWVEVAFDAEDRLSWVVTVSRTTLEAEPLLLGRVELTNEASEIMSLGESTQDHCDIAEYRSFGGNADDPVIVLICIGYGATNGMGQAFWYDSFFLGWPDDVWCAAWIAYYGLEFEHSASCIRWLKDVHPKIDSTAKAEAYLLERLSSIPFDGYSVF